MNGMITNPDKYQAMILGNTNYTFSFTVNDTHIPVKDSIDLLGENSSHRQESAVQQPCKNICTKVNNQINVFSRFRKIVYISHLSSIEVSFLTSLDLYPRHKFVHRQHKHGAKT